LRPGSDEIIEAAELPDFDLAGGLAPIEHALNMRTIYLDSRFTAGGADAAAALTDADEDLKSIEAVLQKTNSAGLRLVLQKYRAELLFLQYSFLRAHSQYNAKGKKIEDQLTKVDKQLNGTDGAIATLEEISPDFVVGFRKRLENLRESSSDTPPYDILEQEVKKLLADFYKDETGAKISAEQLEFWQFKKKIDELLNNLVALGGSLLASAEEIILAVSELYGLAPGLTALAGDKIIENGKEPEAGILAKVRAFREQFKPRFDAGFDFTAEEKGYGYYLILSLLKKDPARFIQAAQRVYAEGYLNKQNEADYYAESSALLIDLINAQLKNNELNAYIKTNAALEPNNIFLNELAKLITLREAEKKEAELKILPQIDYKPVGYNLVTKYGEMGLTTNLKGKIDLAEDKNSLDLPKDLREWEKIPEGEMEPLYKKQINAALSGKYKYTAAKMLLDYLGALIRQRDEGRVVFSSKDLNTKIKLLFDFLDTLPPDNLFSRSYYYQLKIATLKIQYGSSLLSAAVNARDWNIQPKKMSEVLPDYLSEAQELLNDRREHVAPDSTEYGLCVYLLDALRGDLLLDPKTRPELFPHLLAALQSGLPLENKNLPEISGLPEEAKYLYIEVVSRLASAVLAQRSYLSKKEKNTVFSLINVAQALGADPDSIAYLRRAATDASSRLSIGLNFGYNHNESINESKWGSTYDKYDENGVLEDPALNSQIKSKSVTDILEFSLPVAFKPYDFLNLRVTPGLDLWHIKSEDDVLLKNLQEGVPVTILDEPYSGEIWLPAPALGLGFDLLVPISVGTIIWTPSFSGDVNWSLSPQWRSPYNASRFGEKTAWNNHLSIAGSLSSKFDLNKLFSFEVNDMVRWGVEESVLSSETASSYKEQKALSGVLQNRLMGRLNFNFGKLGAYLGGGYLFEHANNFNSGWEWVDRHGWAGELGLSYYGPRWSWGLGGNVSRLDKDFNFGLDLRLTPPNWWPTLVLGFNYLALPGQQTFDSRKTEYDSGKKAVTNSVSMLQPQKNFSVFFGVEMKLPF
jgi:hypothetical protein